MSKIIAVDFDGTLCDSKYPELGEPIWPVINAVLREQKNGAQIILWTCRCGTELDAAVEWCEEHGITFDAVNDNLVKLKLAFGNNTRKIAASEYWDDRAVNVSDICNDRWINVCDGLPKNAGHYLCLWNYRDGDVEPSMDVLYFNGTTFPWEHTRKDVRVSHWTTLPKLPQKQRT